MEQWKPIVGYEGLYEVSSFGRIKSFKYGKELIMKSSVNSSGYICKTLYKIMYKKSFLLHRLVALSFIQNPENKPQVNHINGIKTDNRIENLEWCTYSENMIHSFKIGLNHITSKNHFCKNNPKFMKGKFGINNPNSKPIYQYTLEGDFIREWGSMADITRELYISFSNISACCRLKVKSSGGFKWKYKNKNTGLVVYEE